MITTRLTRHFNIQHPIVCAPMGMVTGGKLAAAVSCAGGLGDNDHLRGVPWPEEFSFRVMKNRITDEWAHREAETRGKFGAFKAQYAEARTCGDLEVLPIVTGEAIGLIGARLPAAEIVATMMAEAEAALKSGAALLG